MKNPEDVQGLDQRVIYMIRPDWIIEHHVQKIGAIVKIGPGINHLVAP
jgi:hypothetical protein